MNAQNRLELKAGIHRYIEDVSRQIPLKFLKSFSNHDLETMFGSVREWESKGFLRIIRDPETSDDNDICIELRHYIEQDSPLHGFL